MANSIFRRPINNFKEIQKKMLIQLSSVGNGSTTTIQTYPTEPGVYRVGNPSGVAGLPSGITGYGVLIVGNAGSYGWHLYLDANKKFYWANESVSGGSITNISAPSKWRVVEGTEVNAAS